MDLKTPLRAGATDDDILTIIETVWKKRKDRYSEERFLVSKDKEKMRKVEMYQIGGELPHHVFFVFRHSVKPSNQTHFTC